MRVSKQQMIIGISNYARGEIIAKVPDSAVKTVIGTAIFALQREPTLLDNLLGSPVMAALVASDNGEYDLDGIAEPLMKSIQEYGNIVITLPKIPFIMDEKTLSFSSSDIGKLKEYIERG